MLVLGIATNMVEVIGGALKEQEESVVKVDSSEEEAEKVVLRRKKKACDPHKKRACVDCTKRCARIHGRASSSSSSLLPSSCKARPIPTVPSFFKVMMGYFSENMDIPPPFAKTILDLAGSNIYLEDAFGLRWRVRMCLRDGLLSFGHGWKNFVLDHAVSCGEFLVFRHIAKSVFTVQMFAPSAVERLYLCERNKRQSRKRKPRQKTSCLGNPKANISKNNVENCKKKQRTDHLNDLGPRDCKIPMHVCIDDSDIPNSASEPKCSETSEKAPEVGADGPQVSQVPTRHLCKDHGVLDGEAEIADACITFIEREGSECNANVREHPISNDTEIEHGEGSNLPANVDAAGPFAMMDLNEVSIDDMFLSADMYEFESDMCDPEAFSVDLNMEGQSTDGQTSGFNCLVNTSQNHHSSMGAGQRMMMSEKLLCTENKQMIDAPGTCAGDVNVPTHDIDINALPANEPSSLGVGEDNPSTATDAEVNSGECALSSCNKDRDNILLTYNDNQAAQKGASGFVPADSSAKQKKRQDGQVNMQPSSPKAHEHPHFSQNPLQTENNYEGLQRGGFESGGVLALAPNSGKFCIAVPAAGQTWLELPSRLPVVPRTKKQGRRVVILKDPCARLWPVLYQCTPKFNGFITGWVDISRENNLREGDTCEFELRGNSELSFQVRMPNAQ